MYEFEYCGTVTFEKTFLVEQMGNFAIQSDYSDGASYYLVNITDMGFSRLFTIGPLYLGLDNNCDGEEFSFEVKKIKFNQKKLEREITNFTHITRQKARLINIEEIQFEEVIMHLPDLIKIFSKRD